jgi:hypothetical protein
MNVERGMHYSGAKVDIIYIQIKMLLFYFTQRYSNASSIFKHFLKNQQLDNIIATVKSPVDFVEIAKFGANEYKYLHCS